MYLRADGGEVEGAELKVGDGDGERGELGDKDAGECV